MTNTCPEILALNERCDQATAKIAALQARCDRLERALMTALVWMASSNPPVVSNQDLCAIDKIIKGE